MSKEQFVLSDWVDNLSDCLKELASYERRLEGEIVFLRQRSEMALGLQGSVHHDSIDNVRERVSRYSLLALREPYMQSDYQQDVSLKLSTLQEVLLEHPTLGSAAYSLGDEWVLSLDLGVSRTPDHQMVFMLRGLVDHAIEHSPEETARELAEMIYRGENHDLSIYSILLFRGLHVERRHDFQGGLSIIAFEEAKQYLPDTMVRSLVGAGTDVGHGPIGAVVSEMKWGPAFVPAGGELEGEWPERPETFREDALVLVDLLAVTHGLPVVSTGRHTSSIEQQIEHLVGRTPFHPRWLRDIAGARTLDLNPSTTPDVSGERLSECQQLVSQMEKGDVRLRLALSRLASSLSRTGMHAALDRVIDVAIALEVMYQLDASRGKGGQLSRRARDLVGRDREDKNWIKRTAEAIYRIRNDIVHGKLPNDPAQAHLDGLELARRTLTHLVRWGLPSEW